MSDTDSIRCWCAANCMKLIIDKTRVITLTRKTISVNHNNKLCDKCIFRTDSIKDLGVISDFQLFFTIVLITYELSHSKCWDLYVR
jgi:hypothetical protein